MKHEELKRIYDASVLKNYGRADVSLTRGAGAICFSEEGKRYVDFTSGIGVNALGYCDPVWQAAVAEQAARLQHVSNLYYTEPGGLLAKRLTDRTGLKKAFFCNSGAEANEGAIKAARKYGFDRYGDGRYEIITLENSFHGRTMATISATGQNSFHSFFAPFLEGFRYVAANDARMLREAVSEKTCAIMIEIVQGEGGVVALTADFVAEIAAICAEKDILFIADEVQTGIGRSGRLFAYECFGALPDIVTSAKALGGGLPIGAVLFGEKCETIFGPGEHGSTFGGNPVACAGALAVMDRVDEDFLADVRAKAEYLRARLLTLPGVADVSGLGLMLGARLSEGNAKDIVADCAERGLLILTAKEKLRLLPPLVITREEMDEGLSILGEALENAARATDK